MNNAPVADAPATISLMRVLRHACPSCGKRTLYAGILKLNDACSHCRQDFRAADVGDGPAFFAITLVGFIVTFAAAWVEYHYSPAYWLHAVIWLPLTMVLSLGILRVAKSYLLHAAILVKNLPKAQAL